MKNNHAMAKITHAYCGKDIFKSRKVGTGIVEKQSGTPPSNLDKIQQLIIVGI
jgi:hypothetical protein